MPQSGVQVVYYIDDLVKFKGFLALRKRFFE